MRRPSTVVETAGSYPMRLRGAPESCAESASRPLQCAGRRLDDPSNRKREPKLELHDAPSQGSLLYSISDMNEDHAGADPSTRPGCFEFLGSTVRGHKNPVPWHGTGRRTARPAERTCSTRPSARNPFKICASPRAEGMHAARPEGPA